MTENIITALSKVPEVFVIARNSVFTYKGKPVKIKQVSEELGVQYVLEGSVQKSNGRLRITAQLIDATGGHHLWADRFDRELKDIFAVQDEVTLNILSALRVEFTHGEQARVQETTDNLEAWSYVVQGVIHFESFTKDDNAKAQELLERAVKLDPNYTYAWAILGWTHWIDATYGYSESSSESFKKAVKIAKKAMELDDKQPDVRALLGGIYLFQRQYDKAIAEGEKAIALAPNIACNKAILAQTMLFAGNFERAITLVNSAMRLNPIYPSWYLQPFAMAHAMIGEHDKAIELNQELLNRQKKAGGDIIGPYLGLAVSSISLGREDDAKTYVKEILELDPNYSLGRFQNLRLFKDKLHMKRNFEALRKAGLPEHPPLSLPDKPSIAVLPFVNMSGDPEQEYFSDGISEEIITAVSKTPKIFVIARTSSFKYKGKEVDVRTVGRELGVSYVLEGSVRKSEDQLRITAQLVDAKTGNHIWAERYDRQLKDIFSIQDDITKNIITALQVQLTEGEQARYRSGGTKNLDAYLKFLKGWEASRHWNKEASIKARTLAEETIALDPDYQKGYFLLAAVEIHDIYLGLSKSPKNTLMRAIEMTKKSIALGDSPFPHRVLAVCYNLLRKHDAAITEAKKAVEMAPNYADGYMILGHVLWLSDMAEEAVPVLQKAIRLNPYPPSQYFHNLAFSYHQLEKYEEAIAEAKKAISVSPKDIIAHRALVSCYSFIKAG
jgi:TolB-like protein/Flp pilus assembly protein TadD